MKEYKHKLVIQNILFTIGLVALIVVQVLSYTDVLNPVVGSERFSAFWSGFVSGVAMGICLLLVVGIVINTIALRKEAFLKKLFVNETDERVKAIAEKGKSSGATVFAVALFIVAIVSGFFSVTVCITLIACTFALSLFMSFGKLYYCKKM